MIAPMNILKLRLNLKHTAQRVVLYGHLFNIVVVGYADCNISEYSRRLTQRGILGIVLEIVIRGWPMTLADRYRKTEGELIALQEAIDNCTHDWVEGEAVFGVCEVLSDPSKGIVWGWVCRQPRDCKICGLHQERRGTWIALNGNGQPPERPEFGD